MAQSSLAAALDQKPYSYADYLQWDEKDRAEIISGELFMFATPSRFHQKISVELTRQLANFLLGKKCQVFHAPFSVRLFEKPGDPPENVDTVVEPDLCVVCDPEKLDDRGCRGAPDLVIEILSPSTGKHDRSRKFLLYEKAGVREYWVADPVSRSVSVVQLGENGRYEMPEIYLGNASVPVGVLEGCSVDLAAVFAE